MTATANELLQVQGLCAGYGLSQVLFGVDLRIGEGEIVGVLGRNGMGKTTLVRSVMGLLRPTQGSVRFRGAELVGLPANKIARHGIALVPEGRQVFGNLSVLEHLTAFRRAPAGNAPAWIPERLFELFPRLAERRSHMGGQLSGGEQQMLAIARALLTNPMLLILDEATEGLAPLVRREIWRCLETLKQAGQSILVIDKNLAALNRIADRHYIVEKGRIVWSGKPAALAADPALQQRYLGV